MERFTCGCGNTLFFGSSHCLKCRNEVGYDPQLGVMQRLRPGSGLRRCDNGLRYGVCNWLIPVSSPLPYCQSCALNRTVPDLHTERNQLLWGRMEMAKRRLIYSLLRLGIPLPALADNPQQGLAFDIISTVANPTVTTGHLNGVITVNLEEADDTYRQINRQQLGESSRTLLGHFRHESGHYLWHRYLSNQEWGAPQRVAFRECFGNEWLDYPEALSHHYLHGPPAGWELTCITGYAASHPWEDWAETWSHYLQIVDGVETCTALGIQVKHLTVALERLPSDAGSLPAALPQSPAEDDAFLAWIQRWMCLSTVLNEIADSLGEPALYPHAIPAGVMRKLRLAHYLAGEWARTSAACG